MNDADDVSASSVLAALAARLRAEFAIDLDRPFPLPAEIEPASLARLVELMPLDLAALLIARALLRLSAGEPRSAVRRLFVGAGEAAATPSRALAELMLEDGETEALGRVAAAEILRADAEAGIAEVPERLAALSAAPGRAAGAEQGRQFVRRSLTGLGNAGHIPLAEALAADEGLYVEATILLAPGRLSVRQRDMLFSLGVLALDGSRSDALLAGKLFARVRAALSGKPAVPDLFRASLRGEVPAIERENGPEAARALLASEFAAPGEAAAAAPRDLKEHALA